MMEEIVPDKTRYFRSRMLWGINAESLSRREINDIYYLLKNNVDDLMAEETRIWTTGFIFSKEIIKAMDGGYKRLGDLYSILESLNDLRFKIQLSHSFESFRR
jgi:hypothetical protein